MDFDVGEERESFGDDLFAIEKMLVGVGVDEARAEVADEAQGGAALEPAGEFVFERIGGVKAEPEFVKHDVPRGFFECDGTQMRSEFVAKSAWMKSVRDELQADPVGRKLSEFGAKFFQLSCIRVCSAEADFVRRNLIGCDPIVVERDEENIVALFAAIFSESPGIITDAVFSGFQGAAEEDEFHVSPEILRRVAGNSRVLGGGRGVVFLVAVVWVVG